MTTVHVHVHVHVQVIVVSWFLQCMRFVQHKGGTIVNTMRQLIRLTTRLASAPECPYYSTYCTPSVQHKVLYAVTILV